MAYLHGSSASVIDFWGERFSSKVGAVWSLCSFKKQTLLCLFTGSLTRCIKDVYDVIFEWVVILDVQIQYHTTVGLHRILIQTDHKK